MASWLVGAPNEQSNSRVHRLLMKERVEAKPRTTIEEIAAPLIRKTTTTPATQTKLNLSAIKSRVHTNECTRANFIC